MGWGLVVVQCITGVGNNVPFSLYISYTSSIHILVYNQCITGVVKYTSYTLVIHLAYLFLCIFSVYWMYNIVLYTPSVQLLYTKCCITRV